MDANHGQTESPVDADKQAFTLIELLVVIAIIAILAALLLPTLSSAKMRATGAACISNQKQLATAWCMYADDNSEHLVNLSTYTPGGILSAVNTPWRTDIYNQEMVPNGKPTTADGWISAIEQGYQQPTPNIPGPLFRYAPSVSIIHCPGDLRYKQPLGAGFAWDSYSGSTFLNGEAATSVNCITLRTDLLHPSQRFVFIEGADERGENVGSWAMANYGAPGTFAGAQFEDSPGAYHGTSETLSYGDGHAESHKWQDADTVAFAQSTAANKDSSGSGPANSDAAWVAAHYAGNQNP